MSKSTEELRRMVGVYTEAVFIHSIALGHGKTHQEAADAIMQNFDQQLATLKRYGGTDDSIRQAKAEELHWFLLQTEIDDGRTKVAYMNDLRQIVIRRLATLNNQTKDSQ